MNLNKLDFITISLEKLARIGIILREEERMTEESRILLHKYITEMLIEKNDKMSVSQRFSTIKKILYSAGQHYREFHSIYAMIDQEMDSIMHGD